MSVFPSLAGVPNFAFNGNHTQLQAEENPSFLQSSRCPPNKLQIWVLNVILTP